MKLNNPFVVRGYSGPEYFCDREKETAELLSSLENEGDVTLIAPRRYGKTGLIHNAFSRLPENVVGIYLDIYATRSLAEFTKVFAEAAVGSLDTKLGRTLGTLARFFKSCRPTITPQESGMPTFSFNLAPEQAEVTLAETFAYLASKDRRVIVAIDEFQQVLEYPETGTEALLRSHMQRVPNVHFVFSGSRAHLMRKMFLTPRHPFYQSTDILSLKPIPCDIYSAFAERFFKDKRKPFDPLVFKHIYSRFSGITWYMQMVLRRLWMEGRGLPDVTSVNQAVDDLVDTRRQEYQDLLLSQTDSQQRLLKAIARDCFVAEPLSGDFITRHGLKAASTVAAALKDLVERDFVYRAEVGYQVYDRFFDIWLRTLP